MNKLAAGMAPPFAYGRKAMTTLMMLVCGGIPRKSGPLIFGFSKSFSAMPVGFGTWQKVKYDGVVDFRNSRLVRLM